MTDIVDAVRRSAMMSGIRGKDTKPELVVRKALFAAGFRFRLHRQDLPGTPDIVLPKYHVVVLVHGCFWHQHEGCRYSKLPRTRSDFWKEKLERNVVRDKESVDALLERGWRVIQVWECATKDRQILGDLPRILSMWILGGAARGELCGNVTPL